MHQEPKSVSGGRESVDAENRLRTFLSHLTRENNDIKSKESSIQSFQPLPPHSLQPKVFVTGVFEEREERSIFNDVSTKNSI